MAGPKITDIQMSSKLEKNMAGVGAGWFTFTGQPQANDIIDIGTESIEFDGVGALINVAIGGTLALTLAAAVVAINADAGIGVHAIVGANDATLNLIAKVGGVAGNIGISIDTDGGGVMEVSGTNMVGGVDEAVTEVFSQRYTITAEDVAEMAAGAQNAEIAIMAIPKTAVPSVCLITAWDTTGLLHPFTNLLFVWRQVGADYFGLFLEDNGPTLGAGDFIDVIAIA